MNNILALETSAELCSVALWKGGDVIARDSSHPRKNHSELVLPMVEALLKQAALCYRDLGGIAFGSGPGSFTGLRIACGVAQGLALGLSLPVVGIVTLQAMAEAAGADQVVACVDARMGEVYHAAYLRREGSWKTVSRPGLYAPEDIPVLPGEWVGCGSGFAVAGAKLARRLGLTLQSVQPEVVAHAREVAVLGALAIAGGAGRDAADALPLYIRDKVALKTSERI